MSDIPFAYRPAVTRVFIAGPRAIKHLPAMVQERLHSIVENGYTVFVGDANGIDKAVQSYIAKQNYPKVKVFASDGKARNNMGKWEVVTVAVNSKLKGFDFYAAKDRAMAHAADYGLMIWNGESKGTLNNILNLVAEKKSAVVYFAPRQEFAYIDTQAALDALIAHCNSETKTLYNNIAENIAKLTKQAEAVQARGYKLKEQQGIFSV